MSLLWTIAGILMAGLGLVPVAAIMALIRRDWATFGNIIGAVVVVYALRWLGVWIGAKSEQWNVAAKIREEAFNAGALKRGNYIERHWRSELSLGVSYWLNGMIAGLVIGLATAAVSAVQNAVSLRTSCALTLLIYALAITPTVWWYVGVWRSASNHFARGGTRFWAGTAKSMVILGFLGSLVATCTTYIPQSIEMLSIIAGDAGMPPYEIRVLPGGTDIEFRGGMRAGCARDLERILAAVPQAKVLHIESPGGRIFEAEEMIQSIRKRGLITYTSEECMSAATLVLISGKERIVAANAKVGFHAGTLPGLTPEQRAAADDLVRATMRSAGVSEPFIEQVLATPPEQMWFPSFDEMLRNGVVTVQSSGQSFATSIIGNSVAAGDLGRIPLFALGSSAGAQWVSQIWGTVRNDLPQPLEKIQLKALIYDTAGRLIASRAFILQTRLDPGVPAVFNLEVALNNLPTGYQSRVQVVEAHYVQP